MDQLEADAIGATRDHCPTSITDARHVDRFVFSPATGVPVVDVLAALVERHHTHPANKTYRLVAANQKGQEEDGSPKA